MPSDELIFFRGVGIPPTSCDKRLQIRMEISTIFAGTTHHFDWAMASIAILINTLRVPGLFSHDGLGLVGNACSVHIPMMLGFPIWNDNVKRWRLNCGILPEDILQEMTVTSAILVSWNMKYPAIVYCFLGKQCFFSKFMSIHFESIE